MEPLGLRVILRAPPLRADVYHLRRAIDGLGYPRHHPLDGSEWSNPNVAWGSVRLTEDAPPDAVARATLDPMTHAGHVLWSHLRGPQFELTTEGDAVVITLSNPKSDAEWLRDAGLRNSDATWRDMDRVDRRLRVVLRADVAHAREAIDRLRSSRFYDAEWDEDGSMCLLSTSVPSHTDWFDGAEHIAQRAAETWLSPRAWIGRALSPHMKGPHTALSFCGADDPRYGDHRDVCFITLSALWSDDEWTLHRAAREERAAWRRSLALPGV
jgi:hypothetical protein